METRAKWTFLYNLLLPEEGIWIIKTEEPILLKYQAQEC